MEMETTNRELAAQVKSADDGSTCSSETTAGELHPKATSMHARAPHSLVCWRSWPHPSTTLLCACDSLSSQPARRQCRGGAQVCSFLCCWSFYGPLKHSTSSCTRADDTIRNSAARGNLHTSETPASKQAALQCEKSRRSHFVSGRKAVRDAVISSTRSVNAEWTSNSHSCSILQARHDSALQKRLRTGFF